jgi:hypothetical protein
VPTRGDREPTSFDITACMHEANLPLGEIAFAAPWCNRSTTG